jgi:hypothetical protein
MPKTSKLKLDPGSPAASTNNSLRASSFTERETTALLPLKSRGWKIVVPFSLTVAAAPSKVKIRTEYIAPLFAEKISKAGPGAAKLTA